MKWHPRVTVEKYSPDQAAFAQRQMDRAKAWGHKLPVASAGLLVSCLHGDLLREMFPAGPEDGYARDEGNIMVNSGLANLTALLTGGSGTAVNPLRPGPGSSAGAAVVGVGSAATAAAVTDTHLGGDGSAATAYYQAMDALYPAVSGPSAINCQSTFGNSVANYTWAEWCIATGAGAITAGPSLASVYATGGSAAMLNHKVPAGTLGVKSSGATWVFVFSIVFS